MNAWLDEEELGFEVSFRSGSSVVSDRKLQASSRQMTGQQRRSQQARYGRRPSPTRTSSAKCRRKKVCSFA